MRDTDWEAEFSPLAGAVLLVITGEDGKPDPERQMPIRLERWKNICSLIWYAEYKRKGAVLYGHIL